MTDKFIKAVKDGDLKSVRMMLANELLLDPRGKSFASMLSFAKDNMPDLFEENQPLKFEISSDKETWTPELLSKMKRDLNLNFSVEKLALYQEMAMWVGRDNLPADEPHDTDDDHDDESTDYEGQRARRRQANLPGMIVTIGGAALLLTGLAVGKTAIAVVGGGALVVGGIVLAVKKSQDD